MKLVCVGIFMALCGEPMVQAGAIQPAPIKAPTFSITLGGSTACVTPSHSGQDRADGGAMDVVTGPDTLLVDRVRSRDPFDGVDKKKLGFYLLLAAAVADPAAARSAASARNSSTTRTARHAATAAHPLPADAK